ncbi:hypothetical protein FVER14953_21199 [Fusarium verticillioides]|nr:hypothetical protein FVER14953_21199 [Fusarium verticillioides]
MSSPRRRIETDVMKCAVISALSLAVLLTRLQDAYE